jgi:cell division protein FtsQ
MAQTSAAEILRRQRRGRILRRVLIAIPFTLVVALAATGVWLVRFSTVLALRQVAVTGVDALTPERVVKAVGVPEGTPLAAIDVRQAAVAVSGLAQVAEVSVERAWPDTLRVKVTERVAAMAVSYGGSLALADASGVAYRVVDEAPDHLPLIKADPRQPRLLADAYAVYTSLSAKTAKKVVSVSAKTIDSIELTLKSGDKVVFGSAEDATTKSQVLDVLLEQPARVYDVSAPAFPTKR